MSKASSYLQAREKTFEAAVLSIGFLMDMMGKIEWRSGGGRGPWEACLAALILAYEPSCKPRRLLEALPSEPRMDRIDFLNTMANLGYYSTSTVLKLEDIETRLLPCLYIPAKGDNNPMTVLSKDDSGIVIYDSVQHKIKTLVHGSAESKTEGEIFFFMPFDQHQQPTSKFMREGTGHSWFGAVVRRFRGTFSQILITCFVLNIFALVPSLFVMFVYDRIISPSDLSGLPALAIGASLALIAEYLLRGIRSEGLSWMTARMDNLIGSRIFSHLISLAPELIEQASVAAQVARIKTFESVRDFFSSAVFLSFLEIPFVLIAIAVMGAIAGPLVLVPIAMVGVYVGLFMVMREKIKRAIRLAAKASSARQQFTIETFEKLRSVRANGLTRAWNKKFEDLSGREVLMNFHMSFLGTIAETLANGLIVLSAVLTIGFGTHLIWTETMTTGALVASMILVWRILMPFYSLCTMIPRLEQLRNSIQQVNTLMDLETELDKTAAVLPSLRGDISLDGVTLTYEGMTDPIISNFSLTLQRGQIAAITGRNGAGKSSLLKLIKGLYRQQAGTVRIDGFDIRQLDALELRHQIAYVPQTPDYFPGSVAENLLIGNPLATLEEVEAALKQADAWDDIQALPQGLKTEINRTSLSPNLASRLSLARAYLQDAPILLIDELPNAVINGVAGQNLKKYMHEGRRKRTVLIVTYRGDLLQTSDIVIQIARGQVSKIATHEEILKLMKEAA